MQQSPKATSIILVSETIYPYETFLPIVEIYLAWTDNKFTVRILEIRAVYELSHCQFSQIL